MLTDVFHSVFLVLTTESVSLWNCFTGLLVAKIRLKFDGQVLKELVSVARSGLGGDFCRANYLVSDLEGRVYGLGLVDGENLGRGFDRSLTVLRSISDDLRCYLSVRRVFSTREVIGVGDASRLGLAKTAILMKDGKLKIYFPGYMIVYLV